MGSGDIESVASGTSGAEGTVDIPENATTPSIAEDAAPPDPPEQENGDDAPKPGVAAQDASPATDKKTEPPKPKETKSRRPAPPPFIDDPSKITIKFIFANRDGLFVILDCKPDDTVGEVKAQLMSMWPDELPTCPGGERLRLICMGKGVLAPDASTMEDCQVPVFKTHATPINVSIKPAQAVQPESTKKSGVASNSGASGNPTEAARAANTASTGCSCAIQ